MKEKTKVKEWAKREQDTGAAQLVDGSLLLAVEIIIKMWPVILNWQWDALIGIS